MHALKRPLLYILIGIAGFSISANADPLIVGVAPSMPKPIAQQEKETQSTQTKRTNKSKKAQKSTTLPLVRKREIVPTKEQAWQAVFDYLANETGLSFQFEPANSQLDFELKLAKGYYDLAYINPLQFIAFHDYPGYKAVTKRKAQPIRSIIFVKHHGPILSLTELRGATIAFPGLLNFPASVVPRESLQRLNVDIVPRFLASERQVFYEVTQGFFIAGAGTQAGFDAQPQEIRNGLKIIWTSPGFTPHAFVAHPRIPFFSINKLQRAMIRMNKREEGKVLLPYIFVDNGFEVARDRDWDEINLIDLDVLNGAPKKVKVTEPKMGM